MKFNFFKGAIFITPDRVDVLSTLHKVIIGALVVYEQIAKFVVSQVMNNSASLFLRFITKVFVKDSLHLLFISIIEKNEFTAIFPNFFWDGVEVLSD